MFDMLLIYYTMLLILFIIIFQVKKFLHIIITFFSCSFKTIFLFKKNILGAILNIIIAIGKVQKA